MKRALFRDVVFNSLVNSGKKPANRTRPGGSERPVNGGSEIPERDLISSLVSNGVPPIPARVVESWETEGLVHQLQRHVESTHSGFDRTAWNPWQSTDFLRESLLQNRYLNQIQQVQRRQSNSNSQEARGASSSNQLVAEKPPSLPVIHAFAVRKINFIDLNVQFIVQIVNIPRPADIKTNMVEAVAESPSGVVLPCRIKRADSVLIPSFQGTFKATAEAGHYRVQIRFLFQRPGMADPGAVAEYLNITVSRNYFRDSSKPCPMFQCEYVPCRDPNTSHYVPTGSKLWGLACDRATNHIYFSDRGGHKITCVDVEGLEICNFGQGRRSNILNRPAGIAYDEYHGRLIVCDKDNHRVCFFTLDGKYISSFGARGTVNGTFNYPWDVDVSPLGGKIIVTDSKNRRIQLFDRFGNYIDKFSVYKKAPFDYKDKFDYPRGVCFDPEGKFIYVTDFNMENIIKVPADFSNYSKLIPDGKLRRPQGIVADRLGNVLVADSRNNCLHHITHDGQMLANITAIGDELVEYPVNLTVLSEGSIAFIDGHAQIHIL